MAEGAWVEGSREAAGDEWFADWFGDEYLELYPHRDEGEARRAVDLVLGSAAPPADGTALDLACGAGRHLRYLVGRGFRAFGLDLSLPLLRRAAALGLPVVRADMRALPVRSGVLSLVTSFFTSFGYFPDAADDARVLAEVRRALRTGGVFAVDYLNAHLVRSALRPRDEEEINGRTVVQTRHLSDGGSVVVKRIEIHAPSEPGAPRVYHERVRLYDEAQMRHLLANQRLAPLVSFGDYGGGPAGATAPRLIVLARAV